MASHRIEIIKELKALEQFCTFKAVRSGEDQERFMRDYLADIEDFPLDAIQAACAEWRRSGSTRFPTPGQLIPLIRAKAGGEKVSERLAEWSPLNDAAYAALSLHDKIRHRRILAANARRVGAQKAVNEGWNRNVAAAPAVYHEFMARAQAHEDEANRLRKYLTEPRGLAAE